MLLFRLSASFLLRLAARRFSGWLFQEPPRTTRRPPRGPLPGERRYARGCGRANAGCRRARLCPGGTRRRVDEAPVTGRLDEVHHRVVHHPVAKGCAGDDARLALVDPEQALGARLVGSIAPLPLQPEQLLLQIQREARHVRLSRCGISQRISAWQAWTACGVWSLIVAVAHAGSRAEEKSLSATRKIARDQGALPPGPPQRVREQRTKGQGSRARRKPMSLPRLTASSQSRLAARRAPGWRNQEPPRTTRQPQSPPPSFPHAEPSFGGSPL
jgi:hypothetical protein